MEQVTNTQQIYIHELLNQKLEEHKKRNTHFSLRSFAKRLGVSAGALSAMISGSRKVSAKMAAKLADRLHLSPADKEQLIASVLKQKISDKVQEIKPEVPYQQIRADEFAMISEWQHMAILSLIKTSDFQSSHLWMAQRLGISEALVKKSVQRLERLKIIKVLEDGQIKRVIEHIKTQDGVRDLSLQKFHQEILEVAKEKISITPVDVRDFTSVTLPANPEKIVQAKQKIREFQEELIQLLLEGEKTEVFTLNINLFPLTSTFDNQPDLKNISLKKNSKENL